MTVIMYAIICGPQALSVAFIPMAMMMTMAGSSSDVASGRLNTTLRLSAGIFVLFSFFAAA
jgi:hypothetical protein